MTNHEIKVAGAVFSMSTARMSIEVHSHQPNSPEYDAAFVPYAIEIGFIVRDWNLIHESLCGIFQNIVKSEPNVVHHAWHAAGNDRIARRMLKAVAVSFFNPKDQALADIAWLVKQLDTFGDQRDNIIHSPVSALWGNEIDFTPQWFFGNIRAQKLKNDLDGKALLDELKRYRIKAAALTRYALDLRNSTVNSFPGDGNGKPLQTLPDRPSWPSARHEK